MTMRIVSSSHGEAPLRLARQHAVLPGPRDRGGRHRPPRLVLEVVPARGRDVLPPHVRRDRRLSPLLLAPDVPHQPLVPVLHGGARAYQPPEGRARGGGPPPHPPPTP